ncbi:hypothetical protein HYV82_06275 [Candidatus Woesearchaeota archaeon]|nr:hypothetical protein [Candidatus Woesearchaeota archaeon]
MSALIDSINEFLPQGTKPQVSIRYSGKFSPYSANVRKTGNILVFSLSSEWKGISEEIVAGLLQSLAAKVFRIKAKPTTSIDLYNNFIRSLHISQPKTKSDPELEAAFDRVNVKYFDGLIEKPNFAWHNSARRLASYDYHTDTISVSQVFRGNEELIDYLMYHELLHKKLKYADSRKSGSGRTTHHSHKFRNMEKGFENAEEMEKRISAVVRKYRMMH